MHAGQAAEFCNRQVCFDLDSISTITNNNKYSRTSPINQPSSLSPDSPLANQLVPLLLDQLGRLIHLEPALKMADPVQDRVPLGQEILEHPSFIFTIKNALGCLDPGFVPRVQEFQFFRLKHLARGA
jgi:hypothetical protein